MTTKRPRVPKIVLEPVRPAAPAPQTPVTTTSTTTTVTATASNRLCKRTETAARLGVSHTQLRRLEADELPPTKIDGVNYHSEQQILEYKIRQTKTVRGGAAADGEVASAAFALFDTGMGPADAVISLKINSSEATELYQHWVTLRGGMFLDAETVARLEAFAHIYGGRLKDGADLIAAIEGFEVEDCSSCARNHPRICLSCYERRPRRAEELLAVARSQHQEREEEHMRRRIENDAARRAHEAAATRAAVGAVRLGAQAPPGERGPSRTRAG